MHTLFHWGAKIVLVVVCGWVLDRGWMMMRTADAPRQPGFAGRKVFLLGIAIGLVFLFSDMEYAKLYS
ncbi:MAG: hypothetical protein OWU32_03145 [Firmicutes bacterium]|nr:hypothetical protein [Bacillota bacterium]